MDFVEPKTEKTASKLKESIRDFSSGTKSLNSTIDPQDSKISTQNSEKGSEKGSEIVSSPTSEIVFPPNKEADKVADSEGVGKSDLASNTEDKALSEKSLKNKAKNNFIKAKNALLGWGRRFRKGASAMKNAFKKKPEAENEEWEDDRDSLEPEAKKPHENIQALQVLSGPEEETITQKSKSKESEPLKPSNEVVDKKDRTSKKRNNKPKAPIIDSIGSRVRKNHDDLKSKEK
ncbi:hypothetical protein [Holospora curviuscula]|uniref:hypothetical protein n=1 Tax=Holospora curviuscula TaxID=1082868 RepID=UPI0013FE307C|nr:hypothetical protein [Holospora curviuscula]